MEHLPYYVVGFLWGLGVGAGGMWLSLGWWMRRTFAELRRSSDERDRELAELRDELAPHLSLARHHREFS
jgi:hypothetical protein